VKVYTYQIGTGQGAEIEALEHSETISAADLPSAVKLAGVITRSRKWRADSNVVRLLEELGEDSRLMWFRPTEVARNA
jgi:hypothetical protein